jgi:type I restriction enzyme, S subunit
MILLDVCELIIDTEHKTAPRANEGYPSIRTPNIGKGRFLLEGVYRVSEETYKKWTRRAVPKAEDLIIAREAPVGNVAMIPEGLTPCLGQRTVLLRPKKDMILPKYLCYYLLSSEMQNLITSLSSGATVDHLNMKDIRSLELGDIPTLSFQQKTSDILSAYDDLIENNLKRIKLLEQAAQNIYKEWFVNMRFPGYENTPINEDTGLPEGWEEAFVNDYFEFERGIEVGSKNYLNKKTNSTIPFLRVGSLGDRGDNIYTKISLVKGKILKFNDLCISLDGSIGLVGYGLEGAYSTGLRKVSSKNGKYSNGFIYVLLKSNEIQDTIRAYARGSTILHASSSINHMKFKKATDSVVNRFNVIIEPIYKQLLTLNKQNQKLKAARDILLPRLMNRTIEV